MWGSESLWTAQEEKIVNFLISLLLMTTSGGGHKSRDDDIGYTSVYVSLRLMMC